MSANCQLTCFGGFYTGSRVSGAEYQEITKTRVLLVFTIAIAQRNNKEIRYAGYEKPIDKGV